MLLSDSGQHRERNSAGDDRTLLDNLEEFFGVSQGGPGVEEEPKGFINTVTSDLAPEAPYDVNPSSLSMPLLEPPVPLLQENDFRQITIKSVVSVDDAAPPPGAVAKIVIKTSNKHNYTKFTFASIDDQEKHSFTVKTSNLMKAITALKPLNLDSIEVIRRLLLLGPDVNSRPVKRTFDQVDDVPEIVNTKKPNVESSSSLQTLTVLADDKLRRPDDEDGLKASLLEHGIKVDSIVRVKIASGQKFWCCPEPGCGKAYGKGHELKLHILGHYNVRPFPCPEPGCDWSFVTRTKLLRHQQSHVKSKPFICNMGGCNRSFTTVYNLNAHLKLHKREFAFPCDKCDQRFQTERELQVHNSQRHKLEMPPDLSCPVPGCSKAYFTKSTLEAHIKTHGAPVSNTTCDICGKTFDKPSRLKTHMVFHTGERPFACDFEGCSWTFPTQSKLSRHKRTHSDVKKFKCPSCDKAFNRSEHLQQHLQAHKAAKNDGDLKSGKNINYLACPVLKCTKKYVTQAAFKAHLRTVHNREVEEEPGQTAGPSDDISAGQLDFVALLSCVDDLQLPVPVQVVESEEVVRGEVTEASEHELLSVVSANRSAVSGRLGQSETSILRSDQSELLSAVSAVCPSNCPGDSASCPGILFSDSPVPGTHHCPSTINLQDLQ